MSDVVPRTQVLKIEYYELHAPVWLLNAVALGSTVPIATALGTKTAAARAAYVDAQAAYSVAKAKTEILDRAIDTMQLAGAAMIKQIKGQAAIVGPSIYPLAQIPAPALPTPVGELSKPENFTVTLGETGAVTLAWKATQPRSATAVTYIIWRRLGATGDFTCVGGTGRKDFTDNTIPAGSASVTYRLQATRSTSVSPWAQFVVSFGTESGGTTIASVEETPAGKIAA